MNRQEKIKKVVHICKDMDSINNKLTKLFNNHTKELCVYYKRANQTPQFFMNYRCNYNNKNRDNCCIMLCPDIHNITQPCGILSQLHDINMLVLNYLLDYYNNNLAPYCKYNLLDQCKHKGDNYNMGCCMAYCPL